MNIYKLENILEILEMSEYSARKRFITYHVRGRTKNGKKCKYKITRIPRFLYNLIMLTKTYKKSLNYAYINGCMIKTK